MILLTIIILILVALAPGLRVSVDPVPACGMVIHARPFRGRAWPYALRLKTDWSGIAPEGTVGDCKPVLGDPLPQDFHRRRLRCAYSDFCDPDAWDLPGHQIGFFQRAKPPDPENPAAIVRGFVPAMPMILGNASGLDDCSYFNGPTSCEGKPSDYLRTVWAAPWKRKCFQLANGQFQIPQPYRFGFIGLDPNGEMDPPAAEYFGIRHARLLIDSPYAASYYWFMLLPVEPIASHPWYDPEEPENVPYHADSDAHNKGPSNDTFTYEMPCYARQGPNAGLNNRGFGDGVAPPNVPAGMKGIIAHSPGGTHLSLLSNYGCGCPPGPLTCPDDTCNYVESQWRYFEGRCAVNRIKWTADPLHRGWWVDYLHRIHAWFAQDAYWWRVAFPAPPQRWAAWYKGIIDYRTNGDVNDSAFAAWIASQDSGFGVEYKPRYSACNDVLINCANQPNSIIGGAVAPAASYQVSCDHGDDDIPPPCVRESLGYSHWHFPNPAATDCSYINNEFPECGIYHEIQRKKYTDAARSTSITQYGWAKAVFQTQTPRLVPV